MFENRNIDWSVREQGLYACSCCGEPLFSAAQKFDSKTGFPSFYGHLRQNVRQKELHSYGRHRTQLLCQQCGQHLGHLFPDPRTPSQVRYCINPDAIILEPRSL